MTLTEQVIFKFKQLFFKDSLDKKKRNLRS